MKKIKKISIFKIKNVDWETLVNQHNEFIKLPKVTYKEDVVEENGYYELKGIKTETPSNKKPVRMLDMLPKYQFLIDKILRSGKSNEAQIVTLNYHSMVEVLGDHYSDMLHSLAYNGFIGIDSAYKMGEFGRMIYLRGNIEVEMVECINVKVIGYQEKYAELIKANQKRYADTMFDSPEGAGVYDKIPKDFKFSIDDYQKCLSMLRLSYKDMANAYIDSITDNNKKERYRVIVENFSDDKLGIYSVDKNNRIYHYLTNLPKHLKLFFNISYEIDVKNSHPLLFCYCLIIKYRINMDIYKECFDKVNNDNVNNKNIINNSSSSSLSSLHKVSKLFHNYLTERGIETQFDVAMYMYATMCGKIWDYFLDLEELKEVVGGDRKELKLQMFRRVFYSKVTALRYFRNDVFIRNFKEIFPNVWETILEEKKELRKRDTNLACKLMKWESALMHEIIAKCYERGYKVVHIHDAIVVLEIKNRQPIHPNMITEIFKEVYASHKLFPTVSHKGYAVKRALRDFE